MKELVYFVLGIYCVMISWFFNHSIFLAIVHWLFWPVYLVYEILTGHLSHGMWHTIVEQYFN